MLNKTPLLHQSLGPHVCLSVCLSLSLHPANSLERRNPSCSLTFLPGLLRPSQEGALYLHPLERAPGAFVSDASPVSRTLLVFCVNQGMLAKGAVHPRQAGRPSPCAHGGSPDPWPLVVSFPHCPPLLWELHHGAFLTTSHGRAGEIYQLPGLPTTLL